jgi:hypothetical protein
LPKQAELREPLTRPVIESAATDSPNGICPPSRRRA